MNFGIFLLSWMAIFILGAILISKGDDWKKYTEDEKEGTIRGWCLITFIIGLGIGALTG